MLFVQPSDGQGAIAVAGDFNGWNPAANVMRHNDVLGVAEAIIQIPPGCHHYRIVVGGRWKADPYNERHAINEHGELNSVVEAPPAEDVVSVEPNPPRAVPVCLPAGASSSSGSAPAAPEILTTPPDARPARMAP